MGWLMLVAGVGLWAGAHMFGRLAPAQRAGLGPKGYNIVAALVGLSVLLMIFGYRWTPYVGIWTPPAFLTHLNNLLVLIAFYLASPAPKKGVFLTGMRHPMQTGVGLWAVAHLLVNGDLASVILFGGLLVWTVANAVLINRAEPEWSPRPKGSIKYEAMGIVGSVILVGAIGALHMLFGLSPFGG